MGQEDEPVLSYRLKRSGPESIIFIPGLGASRSSLRSTLSWHLI